MTVLNNDAGVLTGNLTDFPENKLCYNHSSRLTKAIIPLDLIESKFLLLISSTIPLFFLSHSIPFQSITILY